MFTFQVDLGQVLLGMMMGIIGWFIKRTLDQFDKKIEKHELVIFRMANDLQYIIGSIGLDRRHKKDFQNE